jgi:phosphatidylglycerol:prolipoprotein diacylglycerol transferase
MHFILEILAYTTGFLFYLRLRKTRGDAIPDRTRWAVITAAVAGAALGARLLNWFGDPEKILSHWRDPASLMMGRTIVGALIGGVIAVELTKRWMGETRYTGDLFAAPIALGIAIGRVGCFLEGLPDGTYGLPTWLPWGVNFGDGVYRHPTQLYESLFALVLFAFLMRMMRRHYIEGDVFKVFMVSYMGWRLAVDFLKPGVRIEGLTAIQWACVGMLVYYFHDIRRWMTVGVTVPASALSGAAINSAGAAAEKTSGREGTDG